MPMPVSRTEKCSSHCFGMAEKVGVLLRGRALIARAVAAGD